MNYFFDSYAILEIIKGNKNYSKFQDETIVSTVLNISEIYYALLLKFGEENSINLINKINFKIIEIPKEIAIEASIFRYKNKKLDLSYIDCIGYILSLKNNIKFLTGDRQFETMDNVEFVK